MVLSFLASRMPNRDGAGSAVSASAFSRRPAYLAEQRMFLLAWSKVFVVYFAMTINTESDTVIWIESQVGIFRKALNMVCMKFCSFATALTGEMIALINGSSPLHQAWTQSRPFISQRNTTLPMIRKNARHLSLFGSGAHFRAVDLLPLISAKFLIADRACFS